MYELTLSLPPRTRTVLRDGHIIKVRTPADVLQECGDLVHAGQELFIGLFLNTRNNLIDKRILGLGITRQLVDAGKILNISVLDHVIVGYNDAEQKAVSISLRESGMVVFA